MPDYVLMLLSGIVAYAFGVFAGVANRASAAGFKARQRRRKALLECENMSKEVAERKLNAVCDRSARKLERVRRRWMGPDGSSTD